MQLKPRNTNKANIKDAVIGLIRNSACLYGLQGIACFSNKVIAAFMENPKSHLFFRIIYEKDPKKSSLFELKMLIFIINLAC